jgi:hypothetical protein
VDSTHTFYDPGKSYCAIVEVLHNEILHIHDYLRSERPDLLHALLDPKMGRQTAEPGQRSREI